MSGRVGRHLHPLGSVLVVHVLGGIIRAMDPAVLNMLDQNFSCHHPLMSCDLQDLGQRIEFYTGDVFQLGDHFLNLAGAFWADIVGDVKHEDVHHHNESTNIVFSGSLKNLDRV
ncbi:MAG: hypothetical protein ACXAB9_15775, partial [Candidatus Thorarchaeota archaeon]